MTSIHPTLSSPALLVNTQTRPALTAQPTSVMQQLLDRLDITSPTTSYIYFGGSVAVPVDLSKLLNECNSVLTANQIQQSLEIANHPFQNGLRKAIGHRIKAAFLTPDKRNFNERCGLCGDSSRMVAALAVNVMSYPRAESIGLAAIINAIRNRATHIGEHNITIIQHPNGKFYLVDLTIE